MQVSTTLRSPAATVVGVLFTLVTAYVLLEDAIRHGAPLTTKHVMTAAVLLGTVFFGHALWAEARAWRIPQAIGCLALFLAGTTYCVLSSAGRNAEVVTSKVSVANASNTGRVLAERDMREAKARYDAALTAETKECGSGEGALCKAARITRMVRRGEYDEAQTRYRTQAPEQVANADIQAAAEMLSRIFGGDVQSLTATLLLAFPFVQSLFCEIAAIVGFAIGLGHRPVPRLPRAPVLESEPVRLLSTSVSATEPAPQKVKRVRPTDQQLVLDALWKAGRPLTNEELAKALGVSEGEGSKRRQVCEDAGVVEVTRRGKYLVIRPTVTE